MDFGKKKIKGKPKKIRPALNINVNRKLIRSANLPTNKVAKAIRTK